MLFDGGVPPPARGDFFQEKVIIFSQKLVDRYNALKQSVSDCILLMQVGAFMQVMEDDARVVSHVTGIKLQMAGDVENPAVLGGFPVTGLDAYVGRLARAGHSVAIALQAINKERHLAEVIRVHCDNILEKEGKEGA